VEPPIFWCGFRLSSLASEKTFLPRKPDAPSFVAGQSLRLPYCPGSCLPDLRFGFRVPAGSGSKLMDTRTPRLRHPWMPQLRAHGKAAVLLRADWARRNPRLLFRLSGSLLFRLAERTFLGLLFHEPPRRDRRSLWAAPLTKIVFPKITRRKPSVSAWRVWPIQLCTEGLKSSQSIRPSA